MLHQQKNHHKQNKKFHFISVLGICEAENKKKLNMIIEKKKVY